MIDPVRQAHLEELIVGLATLHHVPPESQHCVFTTARLKQLLSADYGWREIDRALDALAAQGRIRLTTCSFLPFVMVATTTVAQSSISLLVPVGSPLLGNTLTGTKGRWQ